MTFPVVWLPEADAEPKEALARYEGVRPELGQRFAAAIVDTVERIAAAPLQYAVMEKGRQRAGVHRFPYGLFFLLEDARIVVIACFHGNGIQSTACCAERLFIAGGISTTKGLPVRSNKHDFKTNS